MATKVIMPKLGRSVVEGTITKWLVKEGDQVKELDPLLEVETDKVTTDIPSPATGQMLKLLVPEGQTVAVETLLAWIGEPGRRLKVARQNNLPRSPLRKSSTNQSLKKSRDLRPGKSTPCL